MLKTSTEIYDPMLIMIQVATLAFKPMRTKLYFADNHMVIQGDTYANRLARTIFVNSHVELGKLEAIITDAIRFYRPSKNEAITKIFNLTIKGLEQLKNTYVQKKDPTLPATLDDYINRLTTNLPSANKTSLTKLIVEELEHKDIPLLNQKMIAIWNDDAYREVLGYFELATSAQGNISVDVQEKAHSEIELIDSFLAHKLKVLQYTLAKEHYST